MRILGNNGKNCLTGWDVVSIVVVGASLLPQTTSKIMYKNLWFDGRNSRRQLPAECIADCSGPGPADQAVEFWLERLQFDGPAWLIRDYLKDFGAWDAAELCDHQANLARVLWIWAGNCAEDPGSSDYLYLG